MGTIFAPTNTDLTKEYHEIKVCCIIRQSYALARKHFKISCFRFLEDCQILRKVDLIKPDHLISTSNQNNNNIQVTREKS